MKKKLLSALLSLALLAAMIPVGGSASAAQRPDSYAELVRLCAQDDYVGSVQFRLGSTEMVVDGTSVPIDADQEGVVPLVSQGRTMLPARALVEALNGSIDYQEGQVTITAEDGVQIQLAGGDDVMWVDGRAVQLDSAPMYAQNRTFLPVRAISESLGCDVEWEQDTQTVTVTQPCQSCRLVIQTDNLQAIPAYQELLVFGDGLYVACYATVAETEQALEQLTRAGVPAWPDAPVDVEAQGEAAGWEDARCGLSDFARLQSGSRSVTVAVIDSGIDASLPLFQGRLVQGFDFVEGEAGVPVDRYGHGTFVSGLIAQYTPAQVQLLPIRIFDESGLCPVYLSILAAALRYAQMSGADVVNMSLSMYRTPALEQLVQGLIEQGVSVVCSAGNEGRDTAQYTPAGVRDAIVVAATDSSDRPASFSNHGATVDLAAPGQAITSVGTGGQTRTMSGTSFSAPLVTAAGAVLLTRQDYTPAALEQALVSMTSPFSGEASGYGCGILSLCAQAEEPVHTPVPITTVQPTPQPITTVQPTPAVPTLEPVPAPPVPTLAPVPVPEPERCVIAYEFNTGDLTLEPSEGAVLQVHALYSDGSIEDVTSQCGLYSTDPQVVSVQEGRIIAVGEGSALISISAVPNGVALPAPLRVEVQASDSSFYRWHDWTSCVGNVGSIYLPKKEETHFLWWDPSVVSITKVEGEKPLTPNHDEYQITLLAPGTTSVIFSHGEELIQFYITVLDT